jgi:RNA polymerase sigma factor (sigma-70 family)
VGSQNVQAKGRPIVQGYFDDRCGRERVTAVAGTAANSKLPPKFSINPSQSLARPQPRTAAWRKRSEAWRCLMVAAQSGQTRSYEKLLRELDAWLRRYYRRRLPPAAADDARQDALLAIHANRSTYLPSRPFGPWIAAIARHKWVDHVREAKRSVLLSLDEEPMAESSSAAMDGIEVDNLLRRLKPAQAHVICLVKLQGVSIEDASGATGQSSALVKVNIHRGLKRLAALAAGDEISPKAVADPSEGIFNEEPHPAMARHPSVANGE